MYNATAVAEAIRSALANLAEQAEWPSVAGNRYEEDEVIIAEMEPEVVMGKAGEPEAHFKIRTSDGRTWKVALEEFFI